MNYCIEFLFFFILLCPTPIFLVIVDAAFFFIYEVAEVVKSLDSVPMVWFYLEKELVVMEVWEGFLSLLEFYLS